MITQKYIPAKEGKKHITVRNVPENIWKKFRIVCIEKNISAEQAIRNLIADTVLTEEL